MGRVSVGIERENGTVFAGDLDSLPACGALVKQVEMRCRIIVWNPSADGLPGWLNGLDGLEVEGWIGWWRDVDGALMSLPFHPSGCLRQSMSAPLPFPKAVEPEQELWRKAFQVWWTIWLFSEAAARKNPPL